MRHWILVGIGLIWGGLFPNLLPGQTVRATLAFLSDSLQLGQPIELRLRIMHTEDMEVFAPEEAKLFLPFELLSFRVEEPKKVNQEIWNETIYTVRSFQLDQAQTAAISYSYLRRGDTLNKSVLSDTIYFNSQVQGDLEALEYQVFDDIIALTDPPNYRPLILFAIGLMIVGIIVFFLLRNPVRRYLAMRSIDLEWQQIRRKLKKMDQLDDPAIFFSAINALWKSYIDPMERLSLPSLTTTELKGMITRVGYLNAEQQRDLIQVAEAADDIIYAGAPQSPLRHDDVIRRVKVVLRAAYEQKKYLLKHQG